MGADIVGWCECPLQKDLQPEGFLRKLKLRAMKAVLDGEVPPADRSQKQILLMGANRQPMEATYDVLVSELDGFEQGIPQCPACPLSENVALGCYRYVSYPIDAVFERLVFDFFVAQVAIKDSIAAQIYADVVSRVPASGTSWHLARGPDAPGMGCAELAKPLEYAWGGFFSKKKLDSARILASLFLTLDSPGLVVGYATFWMELDRFARERGIEGSRTLDEARTVKSLCVSAMPLALKGKAIVLADA